MQIPAGQDLRANGGGNDKVLCERDRKIYRYPQGKTHSASLRADSTG
ncbi:MAG: hypothetical protein K8R02_03625 [Anaerohalosphaeraceae bacterium]|nr:hypothetical protein [Anaerohalosphaeraceae bacterium]